ncbi:hypothetical protein IX51_11280 [uncultured archaeon]|nr:hypothetical protein IX51_11280 [uncultured archaeon]
MKISVVYFRNQQEVMSDVESYFVASRNPFYLGLIMKPSAGAWEILKSSSETNIRVDGGEILQFDIAYKIEVGENTIFFVKPAEGNEVPAEKLFLKS